VTDPEAESAALLVSLDRLRGESERLRQAWSAEGRK